MKSTRITEENKPHPWGVFLEARKDVILWMSEEKGRDDAGIAEDLSMDSTQVRLIRTYAEKQRKII